MIDTRAEKLLTLTEAAKSVPNVGGKRPHVSTIFRWTRDGVRGGVKLETVRIGRRICTSREALERFFQAASEAEPPEPKPKVSSPKSRTEAQRAHAIAQAKRNLAAEGVTGRGVPA